MLTLSLDCHWTLDSSWNPKLQWFSRNVAGYIPRGLRVTCDALRAGRKRQETRNQLLTSYFLLHPNFRPTSNSWQWFNNLLIDYNFLSAFSRIGQNTMNFMVFWPTSTWRAFRRCTEKDGRLFVIKGEVPNQISVELRTSYCTTVSDDQWRSVTLKPKQVLLLL